MVTDQKRENNDMTSLREKDDIIEVKDSKKFRPEMKKIQPVVI